VTVFHRGDTNGGVILKCFTDRVESVFIIVFVEETEETPDAGAGAVVIF
jgi:hypothetical protein